MLLVAGAPKTGFGVKKSPTMAQGGGIAERGRFAPRHEHVELTAMIGDIWVRATFGVNEQSIVEFKCCQNVI